MSALTCALHGIYTSWYYRLQVAGTRPSPVAFLKIPLGFCFLPLSFVCLRLIHQPALQPFHQRPKVLWVHPSDSADFRLRAISRDMPWCVTVVTQPVPSLVGPRAVEVHGLRSCPCRGADCGGRRCSCGWGSWRRGCGACVREGRDGWEQGSSWRGAGVCRLEASPLVIEEGGLALPFGPGGGHGAEAVDALAEAGVNCLF